MSARFSAAVIGGVNMDISGSVDGALTQRDSNIGRVSVRPGGVGRNIAHDLSLLGLDVSLIAALGGDVFAAGIMESCRALGIDMTHARVMAEQRSSCYLCVNDERGDMYVAVNDMDIVRNITPEYLSGCMGAINRCDAAVLDTNLTPEAIEYLAGSSAVPLYADPVSSAKAERLKKVLPRLAAIKPNALEAHRLTGESDPRLAARALLKVGVKRVFVSLGADGMLAAEGDRLLHLPCESTPVVNTTGAGDAATAAIVWAGVRGMNLEDTARAAVLAGALTCERDSANSESLRELELNI